MDEFFKQIFFGEAKPHSPWFRYGFLSLILALLVFHALDSQSSQHYLRGFIVPLMLLLNHLAFNFRWPAGVTILPRAIALAWIILGGILLFS
jgi:hypothetical protein